MEAQAQRLLKGSVRLGSYLRRLRTGYGYSLRRVEERAKAEGGELDNSQLSRYEKGLCYPSFDKLRVLAGVFNVSVQTFADVVDLEEFEHLKPAVGEPSALIEEASTALRGGDLGKAFAYCERALEILQDSPSLEGQAEEIARGRMSLAAVLVRLGKLALAEQELRHALRGAERLSRSLKAQALLSLANVHADEGDFFLAELEAERAHGYAVTEEMEELAARALHTLARVLSKRGLATRAIDRYREAQQLYTRCGQDYEAMRVRINIGVRYASVGKTREGVRLLRAVLEEARAKGYSRLEAHAWSSLGEAYYRKGDTERARGCLRRSEVIAGAGENIHVDLLFVNAFYEWRIAIDQCNPTREKIAFGRLKVLRSGLEKRFPEVEAFDAYVERGRSHA